MSYINSLSASSSTYSVNRKLDIKSGVIELNKVKIRVNAGDSLQRICNKINSKTSLHFVTAKVARERGHTVISLSSSKQIDILDRDNILNNIGMRIRANLARNSLVDGLILTFLAEHKKALPRYIVQPYQICEALINNLPAVSAIREEVNEFEGLAELFNEIEEEIVFEREQVLVKEKPSCPLEVLREPKVLEPISPISEDLSEENISSDEENDKKNILNNMARIAYDRFLSPYQKMNLAKDLIKSEIPVQGESSFINKTHVIERAKEGSFEQNPNNQMQQLNLFKKKNTKPEVKKIGEMYEKYKAHEPLQQRQMMNMMRVSLSNKKEADLKVNKFSKYDIDFYKLKPEDLCHWWDKASPVKNREKVWQ
jgi:hypothetical protein